MPLTVGGGVRSVEDARALLLAGADKVAVNSAAVARPELVAEIAGRFGIGSGETLDRAAAHTLPQGSFVHLPGGMPHYAIAIDGVALSSDAYAIEPERLTTYEVGYYGVDPATGPERFAELLAVVEGAVDGLAVGRAFRVEIRAPSLPGVGTCR